MKRLNFLLLFSFLIFNMLFSFAQEKTDINNSDNSYKWLSYKMKANVSFGNENKTIQLFYVNRVDSIIYINANVSGIELGRLVATPEEVIIVDKMNKKYYQGSYSNLVKLIQMPLDFYSLQKIMNMEDTTWTSNIPNADIQYFPFVFDDSIPFFNKIAINIANSLNIEGIISNLKINIPGPTSIKIPDKFTLILQ